MTLATARASRLPSSTVAEFVCDQWLRSGEQAEVVSDVFVLVSSIRRVEWVLADLEDFARVRETCGDFVKQGVDVFLVLPVFLLGNAHAVFHGVPVTLVGWVDQNDGFPHFVAPERA